MSTTENLDPFAAAGRNGEIAIATGAPALLHDDRAIAELHQQRLALDERLLALHQAYDEVRRHAEITGGKCPCGGVPGSKGALLTEEAVDEEIDGRLRQWTSDGHRERLERERKLMKVELAEYRAARDEFFERTGMAESLRHIEEVEGQIDAVSRAIFAQPLRTMADLAAALDTVLEYDLQFGLNDMGVSAGAHNLPWRLWEKTPNLARLILAVRQALPDFQFSLARGPRHDYDELIGVLRTVGEAEPETPAAPIRARHRAGRAR